MTCIADLSASLVIALLSISSGHDLQSSFSSDSDILEALYLSKNSCPSQVRDTFTKALVLHPDGNPTILPKRQFLERQFVDVLLVFGDVYHTPSCRISPAQSVSCFSQRGKLGPMAFRASTSREVIDPRPAEGLSKLNEVSLLQ